MIDCTPEAHHNSVLMNCFTIAGASFRQCMNGWAGFCYQNRKTAGLFEYLVGLKILPVHSRDLNRELTGKVCSIDRSDCVLAVYDNDRSIRSGTGMTVNYVVRKKGLPVTFIHPDTTAIYQVAPLKPL